jgi:hypothetical protein
MGYICPDCGEGLPEDTPCPCTMGLDDEDETAVRRLIRGALTAEVDDLRSPVRQFLADRFTSGLRGLQRRYRQGAPPLAVPAPVPAEANRGTLGTAADWLLRFLLHPRPSLAVPRVGAVLCPVGVAEPDMGTAAMLGADGGLLAPLCGIALSLGAAPREVAGWLGLGRVDEVDEPVFTGPVPGNGADPELLARACWVLALLTEVFRAGSRAAAMGPLGRFRDRRPSAGELLTLAPPAALGQLAAFREVFEITLLPELATRRGPWVLGPVFTGSALLRADADLIAAGLLLELKTRAGCSLRLQDVLQVIGYALLDFDDSYALTQIGLFSTRYAYLATWDLAAFLEELAGQQVSIQATRREFRQLLLTCQNPPP